MMLLGQLALLCLVASVAPHKHREWQCDHTPSAHNITYRVRQRHHDGKSVEYHHVEKRAPDQPFRMFVHYDSSVNTGLSTSTLTRIQNTINQLKDFYEQALRIRQTGGPILLDRMCSGGGLFFLPTDGSEDRQCVDTCANPSTCGDIPIPEDHLKACIECNGSPSTCQTVGSDGAGVANADFILYVSAVTRSSCPTVETSQGTVAFAGACQMESDYDRPIAGFVNFCPLSLTGDFDDDFVLAVAKHEILHALAFSSSLYVWWRDGNGNPRTPRENTGYPPQDNTGAYIPSTNTLRTVTYTDWQTRNGPVTHSVLMLVTPRIVEVAQTHFNCSTLEGMEVENQGGTGTETSHWEKRLIENEGMTGIVSDEAVFSRFTFALLEDSGWYTVDYSMAGQLVWGNNQGCEFATGSCGGFIESQQQQNQPLTPFCNRLADTSRLGCTVTRNAVSSCNLVTFTATLPQDYQYFDSGANFDSSNTDVSRIGGSTQIADFCPYQVAFSNTDCANPDNDKGTGFDNIAGESYGTGSRCIEQGDAWTASTAFSTFTATNFGAGCYQYSCSDSRVIITVFGTSYTCMEKGQTIDVEITESSVTHRGTLICPSCVDICYDDFDNCPEASELFSQSDPTESPMMNTSESPVTDTTESPVTDTTESPVTNRTESPVMNTSSSHINLASPYMAVFIMLAIVANLVMK